MARVAPFGSWRSPITLDMLAQGQVPISGPRVASGAVYWAERRAAEEGRTAVVRLCDGRIEDVTPAGFNARTRIHEYGGTSYLPDDDGALLAIEFGDQRVHRVVAGEATPLTPEPAIPAGDRYADLVRHGDVVLAVRERHREGGEPINEIVVFPASGGEVSPVAGGHDFFSSLRRSPDGSHLAWLAWDHPNMPWDGTTLWVASLEGDGGLGRPHRIAGGPDESVFQPEWGPDGELYWSSDVSGWWNLYCGGEAVAPIAAEIGAPQWSFGMACYGFLGDGRLIAVVTSGGRQRLAVVEDGTYRYLDVGHDTMLPYLATQAERVWLLAGDAATPLGLVGVDVDTAEVEVVRRNFETRIAESAFSMPETVEVGSGDGNVTHAFFYPPANEDFVGPEAESPPLIVMSHGGPTSATSTALNLEVQFWTSRGFAVVDVNYRGSTGYGRMYRRALDGQWGVVDTEDCIAVAHHLAERGRVDPERLAIMGWSAGGYTTLCALAFHDVFAAGVSYFGVADLAALAEHTHKFESRYLDSLVGPYPEAADVYRARSPLHHAAGISCAVLLLQGEDDEVVPPSQAETMVEALGKRSIPHAYVLFPGEGHGFGKAETIAAAHAAEQSFYGQVFGFTPADELPRLELSRGD